MTNNSGPSRSAKAAKDKYAGAIKTAKEKYSKTVEKIGGKSSKSSMPSGHQATQARGAYKKQWQAGSGYTSLAARRGKTRK